MDAGARGIFRSYVSSKLSGDLTNEAVSPLWTAIRRQPDEAVRTVVKIMLTAILVGAIGVYALTAMNLAELHVKPVLLGGVAFGGLLFGIGLAVFGYCPGTSVAACGEGRRDALVGVGGMLFGAGLYVAAYPMLVPVIRYFGDWGTVTLPEVTSTSPWVWIVGILILLLSLAVVLQRHEGTKTEESDTMDNASDVKTFL